MAQTLVNFAVQPDPPARLDKALSRDVPEAAALSRTRLVRLIEAGAVRINGEVATNPKAQVNEGDSVEITLEAATESHIGPEDITLEIVYEDDDLVVVNKPAGMVVHPAPGTPSGTLVNALLHHCGDSLSGVGGVARPRNRASHRQGYQRLAGGGQIRSCHHGLAAQFEAHSVERYYLAIANGGVPDGADPRLRAFAA